MSWKLHILRWADFRLTCQLRQLTLNEAEELIQERQQRVLLKKRKALRRKKAMLNIYSKGKGKTWLMPFNAHASQHSGSPLLAITRQMLQLERCSNPLQIQQDFSVRAKK